MPAPLYEQETVINQMRDSEYCTIYTSDTTVMTKLDKLVKNKNAPEWTLVKTHTLPSGEIVGKTYRTLKRLISFRANVVAREMTDEQKTKAAERLRRMREQKKENQNIPNEKQNANCEEPEDSL